MSMPCCFTTAGSSGLFRSECQTGDVMLCSVQAMSDSCYLKLTMLGLKARTAYHMVPESSAAGGACHE